jgi:hypothetical protein
MLGDAEQTSAQPSRASSVNTRTATPAPTTKPSAPPKPGSPVPCDPEYPTVMQCFPKDYNPDAVMDSVATEGWTCLREGDRDDVGSVVSAVRECETKDNVGQPYTIRASISYDTHNHDPSGNLQSFKLYVMTSAASGKGEHTSKEDPTKALITAFEITAKHIWQGKPDQLREATEVFNQLKPQCASDAGRTIEGVTATMPSGYEISCYGSQSMATGDAITHGQSLEIRGPLSVS